MIRIKTNFNNWIPAGVYLERSRKTGMTLRLRSGQTFHWKPMLSTGEFFSIKPLTCFTVK